MLRTQVEGIDRKNGLRIISSSPIQSICGSICQYFRDVCRGVIHITGLGLILPDDITDIGDSHYHISIIKPEFNESLVTFRYRQKIYGKEGLLWEV